MGEDTYKNYLLSLLSGIVEYPTEINIARVDDEKGVLLLVDVNRADMGKVIGVKGQNISAIRLLVSCCGARDQRKVAVKVNEPAGNTRFGR